MHSTSIAFFATLALALSAVASPANEIRSDDLAFGDVEARENNFAFGGQARGRQGGRKGKGRGGKAGKAGKAGKGGKKGAKGGKAATASSAVAAKPAATTAAAVAKAGAPPAASLANAGGGDLQSSTQLDSSVIQTTDNGQNPPVAGQANAATSKNNFINFCALGLPQVPITNGLQITSGSCNPTPIGNIPSIANMPSSKFQSPTNGDTIAANTPFNITVKVQKIQLGTFTNAAKTYYANPQTLNAQGAIIGHTHIVVEAVDSLATTTLTDSTKFLFFKGIDGGQDAQGNVQATVAAGLPVGTYRVGTILSSSTHQPVIMPVAQHGLVDDVIYMTVTANGKAAAAAPPAAAAAGAGAAATAAKGAAAATAAKGAAAATAAKGAAAGSAAKGAAAGSAAKGAAAATAAKAGKGGAAAQGAAAAKAAAAKAAAAKAATAKAAAAKGAQAGKGAAKKGGK